MNLLAELETAGLVVRPYAEWEDSTNNDRDRTETAGIVCHWDAIKGEPPISYYLAGNRYNGIIYHIVIRRDGLVDLLSQRYVWHAGKGSSAILNVSRAGGPVPDDSAGPDDTNGNPYFFSVCLNYHPDDGPVPEPQYEALVETCAVLVEHFGLNPGQVFRHMDWTTRKRDIDTVTLADLQSDIGAIMSAPNIDEASEWAVDAWEWAYENGLLSDASHPKDLVTVEQLMVFLKRYDD